MKQTTAWKLILTGIVAKSMAMDAPTSSERARRGRRGPPGDNHRSSQQSEFDLIVGGEEIEAGSRLYLAVTGVGGDFPYYPLCAGTLISPRVLMTASHCNWYYDDDVEEWIWDPPTYVNFGTHNLFEEAGVMTMNLKDTEEDVIQHPDYDVDLIRNDVTLLILPYPISDVKPVKLFDGMLQSGDPLDVAGWGATNEEGDEYSDVPRAVMVDYMTNEECVEYGSVEEEAITSAMLCALAPGKDACFGDSGGPLVLASESEGGPTAPVTQVGIVSWGGTECADPTHPGVYTRVSEMLPWIKETVCERTGDMCGDEETDVLTAAQSISPSASPTMKPTQKKRRPKASKKGGKANKQKSKPSKITDDETEMEMIAMQKVQTVLSVPL
ncbi:predicted protein [Thalassiosira pseudonana CCMP1335]|uniref:Peptidase S1 domain-containing protein n=1 Tax=Thalassiosira pseudonana TaxID=35128 RepID=B8CBB4_THAPS|nr:predicted protein [Thalassiosira pseudonana CCMP1335]EED89099.1 predicted protein [Thalassiosira pseudonana CCMP1335]